MLAWDDLTHMRLDAGKVKEEREKEMRYIRDMRVYNKIPRSQAVRNGWKIVKTRWVDISKGDDANPVYQSRLVGKEFNTELMNGLFAGTPPLEGLQMGSKVLMINVVSRAFFEAPARRNICIEITKEDITDADTRHDKVAHLSMSLYGTRDAAMNWQEEVATAMAQMGF